MCVGYVTNRDTKKEILDLCFEIVEEYLKSVNMEEWSDKGKLASVEEEDSEPVVRSNKWEGEDEEEEVKDSWEDFDEEKKDEEKKQIEVPKAKNKPKKNLAAKIEEKERKARLEAEKKQSDKNAEALMTPEERRAEILRRQRLQEEADLRVAMETFGITQTKIDAMMPNTPEEFEEFREALLDKINGFKAHPDFPLFSEELVKSLAIGMSVYSLKKVKLVLDNLLIEKTKLEKADKSKKNKGKGKAKLKVEGDNDYDTTAYTYDEYDDFM